MQTQVRRGMFVVLFLLSFPWSTVGLGGIAGAALWSVLGATMTAWAMALGLVQTTTLLACFVLAYSRGLGDALDQGITVAGVTAEPMWVVDAFIGLVVFVFLLATVSTATRHALGQRARPERVPRQSRRVALDVAVLGFLALTFIAAAATNSLSYWGGGGGGESGGIRLELAYPSALILTVGHLLKPSDGYGLFVRPGTRVDRTALRYALGAVVLVLLFVLQSRRLLVAAGILMIVNWLLSVDAGLLRRMWLSGRIAAIVAVTGFLALLSTGWREALSDEDVGVATRMERAFDSLGSEGTVDSIESRFTYLWFDATSHYLRATQNADLDTLELLVSNVVRATPRILMPSKEEVADVRCETALQGFGLPDDLPCSPTSEGVLVGGFLGVVLAGLMWGLFIGVSDFAAARRPSLVSVTAWLVLMPFLMIESGLFALVGAIREGLIGVGVIGALYGVLILAYHLGGQRTNASST